MRGLTLKEWRLLINKADGKLVEQTSFHYYRLYRRIFEVKKWLKLIQKLLKVEKYYLK